MKFTVLTIFLFTSSVHARNFCGIDYLSRFWSNLNSKTAEINNQIFTPHNNQLLVDFYFQEAAQGRLNLQKLNILRKKYSNKDGLKDFFDLLEKSIPTTTVSRLEKNIEIIKSLELDENLKQAFLSSQRFIELYPNERMVVLSQTIRKIHDKIKTKEDIETLIDFIKLRDQNPFKLSTQIKLADIYLYYKGYRVPVSPDDIKFIERYKDIIKKVELFEQKKPMNIEASKLYKDQRLTCKAKTLKDPRLDVKKNFKGLAYFFAIASTGYGYYTHDGFKKENGKSKFLFDLSMGILSTYIGNKIILNENTGVIKKIILKLLNSLGTNLIDTTLYNVFFDSSSKELLPQYEIIADKIIVELRRDSDVATIFNELEKSINPKMRLEEILQKRGWKEKPTQELHEEVMLRLGLQKNYLDKHHQNILKTGSETRDRFYYNLIYSTYSSIKGVAFGLLTYRLMCQGTPVGSRLIGGSGKLKQALAIGTAIFFLDKWSSTEIYFRGRDTLIGQ